MSGKQVGLVVAALVLAVLLGVAVAQADGPVIWKAFCPAQHEIRLEPESGGQHVLCVRMAEEVKPVNNR